jgi:hypothetical protein
MGERCKRQQLPRGVIGIFPDPRDDLMILHVAVDFKALIRSGRGRDYAWKRPESCPCCQEGIWGHGWVTIYLEWEWVTEQIWTRRFRCPGCKKVFRLRPLGYWPRFFYRIRTIRSTLRSRLAGGRWPPEIGRQVGRHWYRALIRQVRGRLGLKIAVFLEGFEALIGKGWVPVSRSIWGVRIPQLC